MLFLATPAVVVDVEQHVDKMFREKYCTTE